MAVNPGQYPPHASQRLKVSPGLTGWALRQGEKGCEMAVALFKLKECGEIRGPKVVAVFEKTPTSQSSKTVERSHIPGQLPMVAGWMRLSASKA